MTRLRLARNIAFLVLAVTFVFSGRVSASNARSGNCTCGIFWIVCDGPVDCQNFDDNDCGSACSNCPGFTGVGHVAQCTDGVSVTCQCNAT